MKHLIIQQDSKFMYKVQTRSKLSIYIKMTMKSIYLAKTYMNLIHISLTTAHTFFHQWQESIENPIQTPLNQKAGMQYLDYTNLVVLDPAKMHKGQTCNQLNRLIPRLFSEYRSIEFAVGGNRLELYIF